MSQPLSFGAGVLLGLGGSLHCVAYCGGLASGLALMDDPSRTPARRLAGVLRAHGGRILSYAALGGVCALAGQGVGAVLPLGSFTLALHGLSSAAMLWFALEMLGLRAGSGSTRLGRLFGARPFLSGLVWGCAPCSMVYGALVLASLSGTAPGGALLMLGFGLGSLPALGAASLGLAAPCALRAFRPMAGVAMIGLAIAGLQGPAALVAGYCAQRLS